MLVISGFKPEVHWKSGHLRTCKYISKTGRNAGFLTGWIRQTKLATGVKPASSVAYKTLGRLERTQQIHRVPKNMLLHFLQ